MQAGRGNTNTHGFKVEILTDMRTNRQQQQQKGKRANNDNLKGFLNGANFVEAGTEKGQSKVLHNSGKLLIGRNKVLQYTHNRGR